MGANLQTNSNFRLAPSNCWHDHYCLLLPSLPRRIYQFNFCQCHSLNSGYVHLFIHHCQHDFHTTYNAKLLKACLALLTFRWQKSGAKNKFLYLSHGGNKNLCPVLALICCVLYLCHHHAPMTTPLVWSFGPQGVTPSLITK